MKKILKMIAFLWIVLLSFSANSQKLTCKDSLKSAMIHGKLLVKQITIRDSLIANIRLKSAKFEAYNLELLQTNNKLKNEANLNKEKLKKSKKNTLYLIGSNVILILILLL